ncbi:MAG TPA: MFS transporter, partial [Paenirhodobacter sp.]
SFLLVVPLAVLALIWQRMSMVSLPHEGGVQSSPLRLLARGPVALGMLAMFLLFGGQFAVFTYLRPYLAGAAGLSVPQISIGFLTLGLAGLAGTAVMGRLAGRYLFAPLITVPAVLALIAVLMIWLHDVPVAVGALVVMWGLFSTAAPVGWGTWLARTLDRDAEAGGGLQVAVIQLAIMSGAAVGGLIFDGAGWQATFGTGAVLLVLASLTAALCSRAQGHSQ